MQCWDNKHIIEHPKDKWNEGKDIHRIVQYLTNTYDGFLCSRVHKIFADGETWWKIHMDGEEEQTIVVFWKDGQFSVKKETGFHVFKNF
jgi:hypothetical protein